MSDKAAMRAAKHLKADAWLGPCEPGDEPKLVGFVAAIIAAEYAPLVEAAKAALPHLDDYNLAGWDEDVQRDIDALRSALAAVNR